MRNCTVHLKVGALPTDFHKQILPEVICGHKIDFVETHG